MNRYFIIYKPYLVQSQFSPVAGKQTLADYFDVPKDVYPVGRLDHDSEGLLILTNDKSLNHRLLHPSFKHEREYWVQVDGAIHEEALQALSKGVKISIDGKLHHTLPAKATFLQDSQMIPLRQPPIRFRKEIPAPWISLTLYEGKNRQVRRMTAKVGFPTLRLIRYRIARIELEGLAPGEIREMKEKEMYRLLFDR